MKITHISTYPIMLTVRPEFFITSSAGKHAVSRYLVIAIHTDEGIVGWGEATVVPLWSGESRGGAEALIHDYFAGLLIGKDPEDLENILREMDAIAWENHFTKAAVEMALLDLIGKKQNRPVYELLGGAKNPKKIPIKFSIGLREPEDAARIAAQKVAEGFTALKIKVGLDHEKDLLRARLVREAAPHVKFNVDVNGGWSVEDSIREIPRYAPFNLDYVEQPTPRWDIEALAKVRQVTGVRIMADESVFSVRQAEQAFRQQAADLISIYPGKNGGMLKAQKICKLAEEAGVGCHLGSNLEWDIGTSAMCHLTVASSNVQIGHFPVDILGPLYYAVHPKKRAIRFERGHVFLPEGPGLGLEIQEEEIIKLFEKTKREAA
jgi:L-alanine-DL-glutamate epimerase-like enolase superfamily enzyme